MNQAELASTLPQPPGRIVLRLLALVLLFGTAATWECITLTSLKGGEIWGHLRIGSWILEQHAVPHTGIFSQVSQQTWRDYSWGYDSLLAIMERFCGIRAVPAAAVLFRVSSAVVAFLLAGGMRERFWIAVVSSFSAQFAFSAIYAGPANCSLVLFGITLLSLLTARQSGQVQIVLALPAIVLIWVNLDSGFMYGIALIGLFSAVNMIECWVGAAHNEWLGTKRQRLPIGVVGKLVIGCFLASFCNPYGYYSYEGFSKSFFSQLNGSLPGYASISFHRPQDYVLLLLTMGAALSLGLRRSRDLFLILLLAACAFLSFHAERESWLVGLAALAVIGSACQTKTTDEPFTATMSNEWIVPTAATSAFLLAILAFFSLVPSGREVLLQHAATAQPVGACDYIRRRKLPQPLFNPYDWGGFVSWYLPEYPVSIDQRRGLYPEDEESTYFKVMNAEIAYREYAPMKDAQTLLFPRHSVMGEALRDMPGYRVAYEDGLSLVLQTTAKELAKP